MINEDLINEDIEEGSCAPRRYFSLQESVPNLYSRNELFECPYIFTGPSNALQEKLNAYSTTNREVRFFVSVQKQIQNSDHRRLTRDALA